MSVDSTQPKSDRHRTEFSTRARYRRFAPPPAGELDAALAASHHLQWLLANMDWFAQQGRGALSSASVALHRDLAALSGRGGSGAAQTAAAEQAPAIQDERVLALLDEQRRTLEAQTRLINKMKAHAITAEKSVEGCCVPAAQRLPHQQQAYDSLRYWLAEIRNS